MLGQEGDHDPAPPHRCAGVGLFEPGDQLQHRRLARAVRADNTYAGAGLDREIESSSTVLLPNDLRTALRLTRATALARGEDDREHVRISALTQRVRQAGVA